MADCGLFDGAAIEQLITQHEQGRSDHATPLWLLLAFEGFLEAEAALQVPVARAA
jgi:asparagine synthase (glutamine-hydrolysing)